MKQLVTTLIVISTPLIVLGLWLFRSRLTAVKARMRLALRVGAVGYLGLVAYRLSTSPMAEEQLTVGAILLLAFGGMWAVAWFITRLIATHR